MNNSVEHKIPQSLKPELTIFSALINSIPEEGILQDFETLKNRTLAEIERYETSIEGIQVMDINNLTALQGLLGHGYICGYWQTPRRWKPGSHEVMLNIDIRMRIIHFLDDRHKQIVLEADEALIGADTAENAQQLSAAQSRVHRILDEAVLTVVRYLVLCRIGPVGMRKAKYRSLDASTLTDLGYKIMPPLVALGVAKRLDNYDTERTRLHTTSALASGYLELVRREDVTRLSEHQQELADCEIKRMQMLADMGLWVDIPILDEQLQKTTDPSGTAAKPKSKKKRDPHLPLPDDYVAEMGRKSLWIIQELGPNLLAIGEEMQTIWRRTEDFSILPLSVLARRDNALRQYLQEYVWRDSNGNTIKAPPFEIRLSKHGKNSWKNKEPDKEIFVQRVEDNVNTALFEVEVEVEAPEILAWPPRTFAQITGLWALLQRAHIFVVGMSEGARAGEILTQQRDCVKYADNGLPYANGLTFKLVDRHAGAERDWILPDVAVQAIEQQGRLIKLAEEIGQLTPERMPDGTTIRAPSGNHLWGMIGGSIQHLPHQPLLTPNTSLRGFARDLGMDVRPSGQYIRSHRFRKTIARLAALALTDSAKILMNVFGHKNIEMTLHYILADKDLQADIRKVTRELQVMRAKEAIETMVAAEEAHDALLRASLKGCTTASAVPALTNGGFGGGAAARLNSEIKAHREKVHKQARDFGAISILELAERFTAMGMAWDYVRPGVLCIKSHTQAGACTHKIGKREVSHCQAGCDFHLVHPRERENVDGSIRDCLQHYNESREKGDDWMQEVWATQVLKHLGTFDDLRIKWMEDSTVRQLVDEADANGVEA